MINDDANDGDDGHNRGGDGGDIPSAAAAGDDVPWPKAGLRKDA